MQLKTILLLYKFLIKNNILIVLKYDRYEFLKQMIEKYKHIYNPIYVYILLTNVNMSDSISIAINSNNISSNTNSLPCNDEKFKHSTTTSDEMTIESHSIELTPEMHDKNLNISFDPDISQTNKSISAEKLISSKLQQKSKEVGIQRYTNKFETSVEKTSIGNEIQYVPNENNQQNQTDQEDDASVLVIILQCETKPCDDNINELKYVFSNPYFIVQVCAVDLPSNIPVNKTLTKTQYTENYFMRKALTYAAEGPYLHNSQGNLEPQAWWNDLPVIIVKDSSVSNLMPVGVIDENYEVPTFKMNDISNSIVGGMKRRISTALDKARQADLFFLCKWHDACNKYIDIETGGTNYGSTLKWSLQPTATQAIMYTPSSRDYIIETLVSGIIPLSDILNTNIAKGKLLATVFVPNIIDYDISLATSNKDYNKLNECAPVEESTTTNTGVATFVWLAIVVILIILVAWVLIQLGPRYSS